MLQYDHCQHAGLKLVEFRCADRLLHWLEILLVFEDLATHEILLKWLHLLTCWSTLLLFASPYQQRSLRSLRSPWIDNCQTNLSHRHRVSVLPEASTYLFVGIAVGGFCTHLDTNAWIPRGFWGHRSYTVVHNSCTFQVGWDTNTEVISLVKVVWALPGVEQSLTCVRFSWGKLVVEVFFVSWRRTTKDNRKHKRRGFDIVSPIHWDGPRWTSQSCPRPSAFRAFRVWSKTGENWLPKMSPNANLFLGCFGGLLSVGLSWFYAPMKVMAGRLLRTDFPVVIDPVLEGAAKYYILGSQDSIWKRGWDESSLQPRKG